MDYLFSLEDKREWLFNFMEPRCGTAEWKWENVILSSRMNIFLFDEKEL
jgi:hypothetical protein